jgi:hypothetical protein
LKLIQDGGGKLAQVDAGKREGGGRVQAGVAAERSEV